jgi:hypothetical protein
MKINGISVKNYLIKELAALNLRPDSPRVQTFLTYYLDDMVDQVKQKEITIDQAVADLPFFIRHLQV